jgi:hypothetical protein
MRFTTVFSSFLSVFEVPILFPKPDFILIHPFTNPPYLVLWSTNIYTSQLLATNSVQYSNGYDHSVSGLVSKDCFTKKYFLFSLKNGPG